MKPGVLLTAAEMGARWGYKTRASFMQAVHRRGIPKVYIGRSVRFDPIKCAAWLDEQNDTGPGRPMPAAARASKVKQPASTFQHTHQVRGRGVRDLRETSAEIREARA